MQKISLIHSPQKSKKISYNYSISKEQRVIILTVPQSHSEKTSIITMLNKLEVGESNKQIEYTPNLLTLFRCIYIDSETNKIISIGQKERCVFCRENKSESDYQVYKKYIDNTISVVEKRLNKLKKQIKDWKLDANVIHKLLLNLRYLVKHAAFKEEQECRIIQIKKLKDSEIVKDENNCFYVDYLKLNPNNVEKIVFAPRAKDIDKYRQHLAYNDYRIECYQSKAPLAKSRNK